MTHQFFRLFTLLILSLLLLAWSLDQAWNSLSGNDDNVISISALFTIHDENEDDTFQHLALSDLAWPAEMLAQLQAGDIIQLENVEGEIFYYRYANEKVTRIGPLTVEDSQTGYNLVVILFYLGVALVIVIWLWPLFKDLQQLRSAAEAFGRSKIWQPVQIRSSSMAAPMADTLNAMAQDLAHIIALQKQLSRTVGHEIRTPLARIQFSLESLKQHPDPDEIACIIEDIEEIEALTDEFLQLARLEHRGGDIQLTPHSPHQLITTVISQINRACDVDIHYHESQLDNVLWEQDSIRRLLQNLLTNAAKYANQEIQVSLQETDTGFCLRVEDDGQGFGDNPDLTQPFAQQNTANIGYGLGLAIVDIIAGWYHGTLELGRSERLGGAEVRFSWPSPSNTTARHP